MALLFYFANLHHYMDLIQRGLQSRLYLATTFVKSPLSPKHWFFFVKHRLQNGLYLATSFIKSPLSKKQWGPKHAQPSTFTPPSRIKARAESAVSAFRLLSSPDSRKREVSRPAKMTKKVKTTKTVKTPKGSLETYLWMLYKKYKYNCKNIL